MVYTEWYAGNLYSHLRFTRSQDNSTPTKNTTMNEILTHIKGVPIKRCFKENLPYNSVLKKLLPQKRKAGILGEVLFWKQVRARTFHNIDFDRQRIIGNYIVDFYVKTLGLIIEIDGSSHDEKVEYDKTRQAYLESFGLLVFRITDFDIKQNTTVVMKDLEDFIIQHYKMVSG